MLIKFYDTSSLLLANEDIFKEHFIISSITIKELEDIKYNPKKDGEIKNKARRLLALLDERPNCYDLVIYKSEMIRPFVAADYEINNDLKILACAYSLTGIIFVTNDLILKQIANSFDMVVESIEPEEDDYTGYKDITMTDEEMDFFYSNPKINNYNILRNEYINILNTNQQVVDTLFWDGEQFNSIPYRSYSSYFLGEIKPKDNDVYQKMLFDSFSRNKVTMAKGPAGTGKSICSLGFLFNRLRTGKIDRIIVFCNTVAAKGAAKLGFYPGEKDDKLLDSQIGNMLSSKMGGMSAVLQLIQQEKLILLPASDIRGYDTSGMRAGVYITEAQNLDIYLIKLFLQRLGEDSICIIDGDDKSQVDDIAFSGINNGMRRVSKVFRGQDFYGEVALKNIYRSKVALIAEQL